MILKLIISKGYYSANKLSRSYGSYCLMLLYNCVKFHENIFNGIKVIKQTSITLEKFQRGIISQKL